MKEKSELKKNDDKEETQKLKPESNPNKESQKKSEIITSIETNNRISGRDQQICVCPFCNRKIFTDIEHEASWIGVVLSILFLLVFKIYGIIFIILIIRFTQNTTHYCSNCLNKIGTYTVFDALALKDKVFTFKFSSFGLVITKKHIFSILLGLFCFFVFISFASSISISKQIMKETWADYVSICAGGEVVCKTKFLYQEISWAGYVIRVNFNDNFFSRTRAFFLVKMDPNIDSDKTDLVIEVTDSVYNKYKIDIMNITRGDEIEFNATVRLTPNYQTRVPVVTLDTIRLTAKNIDINPHVHENGRYGTNNLGDIQEGQKVYHELPNIISKGRKNLKPTIKR